VNVTLFPKLTYSPTRDLTPISIIADVPNCLVVNRDFKANTVADLIKAAKSDPGDGTPPQVQAALRTLPRKCSIAWRVCRSGTSPIKAPVLRWQM
jgi:hypothetical protein